MQYKVYSLIKGYWSLWVPVKWLVLFLNDPEPAVPARSKPTSTSEKLHQPHDGPRPSRELYNLGNTTPDSRFKPRSDSPKT